MTLKIDKTALNEDGNHTLHRNLTVFSLNSDNGARDRFETLDML